MNLFKIEESIEQVLEAGFVFDEETGEVKFTEEDLNQLKCDLNRKLNNIIGYIKNLEYEEKSLKEIEDSYKKRRETVTKKKENLKKYLQEFMLKNNKTKIEADNGICGFRKSSTVEISNETALLAYLKNNDLGGYKVIPESEKVDKTQLKQILKENAIEFACIKENTNLTIK